MISSDYCRLMARYNHWMNGRVYALLAPVGDEERKRDRGAYFKSIHGTLAHILWADRLWLARFTGSVFAAPAWGQGWIDDFTELAQRRDEADAITNNWASELSPEWLSGTLRYVAKSDGRARTMASWMAVAHFFNHQAHHRGQVTTLLSQIGIDPGVTDLAWLPGVMRSEDPA